jgi:hypothetical protein
MDSDEEIETFYKNWLSINSKNKPSDSRDSNQSTDQPMEENLTHIIFQNNIFELYVEKGK